jgi:formylglycine-generating enzyme required for sulfatase activity
MPRSLSGLQQHPKVFPFLLTQRRRTQGFREALEPAGADTTGANASTDAPAPSPGTSLTMLWIPPGRFWMGSADTERERTAAEGPQHLVQLQGFFLGQTPITQAQWRAVAQWQPLEKEAPWPEDLDPNPVAKLSQAERFVGDQRPVVNVSWQDAMAFCRRISQRTGRLYTLPSEAQWEYACRASTTTPFHFGGTLSTALANYNGTATYGDGEKGGFREQTTDVGTFPANAWGLQDMHGNVWEWCADHWHENYEQAPDDGRAWLIESSKKEAPGANREATKNARLLRGGSWSYYPRGCRSASRFRLTQDDRAYSAGFRVCFLPQDLFLQT